MNKEMIVSFENVSVKKNNHLILKNICLEIFKGQVLSIIGPNGGGKTTMIETMLGICKPSFGNIKLNVKRTKIGYMPQCILKKNHMPLSCLDFVYSGFYNGNNIGFFKRKHKLEIANQLIDYIGLNKIKYSSIYSTSGGQFQLLSIARSIVNNPELLVLDEPTSNTDSNAKRIISKIINEIKKNTTVILSSHDEEWISRISDQFFCVHCYGIKVDHERLNDHMKNR